MRIGDIIATTVLGVFGIFLLYVGLDHQSLIVMMAGVLLIILASLELK